MFFIRNSGISGEFSEIEKPDVFVLIYQTLSGFSRQLSGLKGLVF
jgi:hypothetical protein